MKDAGLLRIGTAAAKVVAAFYLGIAAVLALVVPYHEWDVLPLSGWSRTIAETGMIRFSGPGDWAWYYHRPLFYVTQGWLWRVFGFHESLGRVLAWAFALVLIWAIYMLGRRADRAPAAAWLGVLLLLAVPGLARGAISGLTDVPIAALVGATAAVSWCGGRRAWRVPAVAACAALAALTKPSAFPSLVGLAAAHVVGRRDGLRERVRDSVTPILAACGMVLLWHDYQARALGQPLSDFLRTGTMGFYADLAARSRRSALLNMQWLGPALAMLIGCSTLYALLRVVGIGHARALRIAAPAALAASWLGPWVVSGGERPWVGPLASGELAISTLLMAGLLMLAAECPEPLVPSRENLARLLVWAAPGFATWLWVTPYDVRLLSGAWPPMILLVSTTAMTAWCVPRLTVLRVAAGVAILTLALSNWRDIDGGWEWRKLPAMVSATFHGRPVGRPGMKSFEKIVDIVRAEIGTTGRLFSSDGRFSFFFPGRQTSEYPRGCEALRGHQVFVLISDGVSRTVQEHWVGAPADPAFWATCSRPSLTEIGRVGSYVIFRVGPETRS